MDYLKKAIQDARQESIEAIKNGDWKLAAEQSQKEQRFRDTAQLRMLQEICDNCDYDAAMEYKEIRDS